MLLLNLIVLLFRDNLVDNLKYFLICEQLFRITVFNDLSHPTEAASDLLGVARIFLELLNAP